MSKDKRIVEKHNLRFGFLIVIVVIVALIYIGRLVNLQIINGADFFSQSERGFTRTLTVDAPRGGIYDRNGVPLVINESQFNVELDAFLLPEDEQNEIILRLLDLVGSEKLAYSDSLSVSNEPYEFLVDIEGESEHASNIKQALDFFDLEMTSSAEELMAELIERYDLEGFDGVEQRTLAAVRFEMEKAKFSVEVPFVFAADIDMEEVIKIEERADMLLGVEVVTEATRVYQTEYAAHIIGRVGPIPAGDAQSYLDNGYQLSDTVGIDGIERTMESYLRGVTGTRTILQNKFGSTLEVDVTQEPQNGKDVILTIDIELQKVAEESLERVVGSIAARGQSAADGEGNGYDADAGAVVAIDINTGEVLAMASYPTYDLSTFTQDYSQLLQDPTKPMLNRAISGTYAPGSTFKMLSAMAALESGVIDENTIISCTGRYQYFAPSYTPACWVLSSGYTHGAQSVVQALQNSCNIFFFEAGRLTGIETHNALAEEFGFGTKTGIELIGESNGILAGPEYREKNALRWNPGDTIQAAIGQSDNAFTPIQLASYTAAIANGDYLYQPTLIKDIQVVGGASVADIEPIVVQEISVSDETLDIVKVGMRNVAELGTAASVFGNYAVDVAGKSGTAEVSQGSNTGVFVAFAPYENPEIAVAVVVEHGTSGNSVAPVIRDVLTEYFRTQ